MGLIIIFNPYLKYNLEKFMIKKIINLRSKTITFSAALVAFSVGVSAILGLLRDRLLVTYFPVSELDIYFAAFRIPDFIYGILITGGIVAVFLPVFSETFEKNKKEGWRLANNILNVLLIFLLLFCSILFVFAPQIIQLIVPGFSAEYIEKTVLLTRIMLVSPIILGISGLFSGVLQYFDRFLAYSLSPIFYNIGIILGIIFLVPSFGLTGLAYGVILGSILHLIIQIPPAIFSGFSYRPVLDLRQKELHKIFYLMIPRVIGQASMKINIIVITALASLLTAGSVSIFNLAEHLQSFPVRIIGVAFAVAAFPAFSRAIALKNKELFLSSFSKVICQVLFFIIPASVLIFLLRAHIVRLVLGVEGFGWQETQLTAASLGIFSFSFFAAALIHILVRAFFSFQDTKTPVIVSLIAMGINIILSVFFVWILGFNNIFRDFLASILKIEAIANIEVIAFPLAILISAIIHFILLTYFLRRKLGKFKGEKIIMCFKNTLVSSFIMGLAVYLTLVVAGTAVELKTFMAVLFNASLATIVAVIVYVVVSKMIASTEMKEIWKTLINR